MKNFRLSLSGPHPDIPAGHIPDDAARGRAHDLQGRGPERFLQVAGAAVGKADPLHHDEVRLLREDRRVHLRQRRAQAEGGVHKGNSSPMTLIKYI